MRAHPALELTGMCGFRVKHSKMYQCPASEPSVCIPRISPRVSAGRIRKTFEAVLGPHTVDRIDIVPWRGATSGPRRAFVHMTAWPDAPIPQGIRARLLSGKEVKIMYDDPWFWRCARSRVPKPPGAHVHGRGPAPELLEQVAAGVPG